MEQQNQLNLVWQEVLAIMASELATPSFDAWLKDSRPVELEGNTLYVEFPNEFTKDWVEARYTNPLHKTLRQVVNRDWDIRFVIPRGVKPLATTPSTPEPQHFRNAAANGAGNNMEETQREVAPAASILNERYTFDSFVVGNSNRFAHAASLAVAEAPARAYNPLFLYGGVGLGKTHLMHAIGHHALALNPNLSVYYVTSETFTNDLITAIGKKSMVEFRNKYRNVDILLVDDIQFVAGKESTQEEFFHTFNALYEANRQLIISSDRPPKDIPTLEERLRSRFEWGLITDIQPPDLETRIAILRKKAAQESLYVEDEVLHYIATHIQSNIRELEGALVRVNAYAALHDSPINLSLVTRALQDIIKAPAARPVTVEVIQEEVAKYFGIKTSEMKSKRRTRNITFPRQIAMYLSRELTDNSLSQIGAAFGGRDHTTVIHAYEKIDSEMKLDPMLKNTIEEVIERIHRS
ncbi:MAG: chromosomal replication initiator protein DnaA [Firmicutes bacterium]|jgi:chromosomal replication initiator protein|nr:chromosomal replication initiator protein DnaA [Bacillota bacterium]NLO66115.1 chromosomal replication initiator protein DnaA [Bacillota bacterium]